MDVESCRKLGFPRKVNIHRQFWLITPKRFILSLIMSNQLQYLLLVFGIGCFFNAPLPAQVTDSRKIESFVEKIQWLGQSSIKISTEQSTIYIDPFRFTGSDQADIIFITHDHKDHLDPSSLSKLMTDRTIVVAPLSCQDKLDNLKIDNVQFMSPWDSTKINGIHIKAVPAYNIKKHNFHPKNKNYLGYLITIDEICIYHAGDTERIPEMQQFSCDIALLPLGQKYTMNSVYDAANAALDVKATVAIPIHYGLFEGKLSDAKNFQEILRDKVKVIIKSPALDK